MPEMPKRVIAFFLSLAALACPARADTIVYKSGKKLEGRILEKRADCAVIKIPYMGKVLYIENRLIDHIESETNDPLGRLEKGMTLEDRGEIAAARESPDISGRGDLC